MAKKQQSAGTALEEIESAGERLASWVGSNPALVLGTALAILAIAGGYGFLRSSRGQVRDEASSALARASDEYRQAMGGLPTDLEVSEPANPAMARQVREDFAKRYREVAEQFPGTPESTLARMELGEIQRDLGDPAAAIATWREAAASAGEPVLKAFLLGRIAAAHEQQGEWLRAAEAYEEAAAIESYPLRERALAEAARCFAAAGEARRALDAFARVEIEAPDLVLPPYVKADLEELRASELAATPLAEEPATAEPVPEPPTEPPPDPLADD